MFEWKVLHLSVCDNMTFSEIERAFERLVAWSNRRQNGG